MDNNNSMLETHFFDYLRSISDKQTVNPQEIYSIKTIMKLKKIIFLLKIYLIFYQKIKKKKLDLKF